MLNHKLSQHYFDLYQDRNIFLFETKQNWFYWDTNLNVFQNIKPSISESRKLHIW
jgi:hypothetical protein